MKEKVKFFDKIGRDICPGDFFVYAVSVGRSPSMTFGMALDYREYSKYAWNRNNAAGTSKLKMIGASQYGSRGELNDKPGYLEYPERVWKVSQSNVPADLLRAFKRYYGQYKQDKQGE